MSEAEVRMLPNRIDTLEHQHLVNLGRLSQCMKQEDILICKRKRKPGELPKQPWNRVCKSTSLKTKNQRRK